MFLGVAIDEHLTLESHLEYARGKLSRSLGFCAGEGSILIEILSLQCFLCIRILHIV